MGDQHWPCGTVVLISGGRRVGKTTLLLAMRSAVLDAGLSVGGILSAACFETGEKTGINLMDVASGDMQPLARIGGAGAIATGHYVFEAAALDAGRQYALAGQGADVFFVDELGPLELKQDQGWTELIEIIRARRFGVALVTMRPELVDLARTRFNLAADSPMVVVDEANRAELVDYLMSKIGSVQAKND